MGDPDAACGWYCCGRVLATYRDASYGKRSLLLIGLLDWCEPHRPTSQTIAGAMVTDYAAAHVKTIRESGGQLLGHRPLEEDGGLPTLLGGRSCGFDDVATWGYMSIEYHAHHRFGRHFPADPAVAMERPSSLHRPFDQGD